MDVVVAGKVRFGFFFRKFLRTGRQRIETGRLARIVFVEMCFYKFFGVDHRNGAGARSGFFQDVVQGMRTTVGYFLNKKLQINV